MQADYLEPPTINRANYIGMQRENLIFWKWDATAKVIVREWKLSEFAGPRKASRDGREFEANLRKFRKPSRKSNHPDTGEIVDYREKEQDDKRIGQVGRRIKQGLRWPAKVWVEIDSVGKANWKLHAQGPLVFQWSLRSHYFVRIWTEWTQFWSQRLGRWAMQIQ